MTMTSHSHHRVPWRGREFDICLKSEASVGVDDSRPGQHMVVEVTLDFFAKFAVPSLVVRGYYEFGSYIARPTCYTLQVDDPLQRLSMVNATGQPFAPLLTDPTPLRNRIFGCLSPEISRLARETLESAAAEIQGNMAVKMHAHAVCSLRVDFDTAGRIADHYRRALQNGIDGGELVESLGTCSVCLEDVRKEWIWPTTLACSHVFHLGCIAPWLQRHNSCPLCRSTQPIFIYA